MSEVFVGQIMMAGFSFAPRNFAQCNGQLLPISQNQALYSLLGTQYGGDGRVSFALPDLRGRVPVGSGSSADPAWQPSRYDQGQAGGAESVTLLGNQLPSHTHAMLGTNAAGTLKVPTENLYGHATGEALFGPSGGTQAVLAAQTLGMSGGGEPHANMQPYKVINFAIALTGIFPSRN